MPTVLFCSPKTLFGYLDDLFNFTESILTCFHSRIKQFAQDQHIFKTWNPESCFNAAQYIKPLLASEEYHQELNI